MYIRDMIYLFLSEYLKYMFITQHTLFYDFEILNIRKKCYCLSLIDFNRSFSQHYCSSNNFRFITYTYHSSPINVAGFFQFFYSVSLSHIHPLTPLSFHFCQTLLRIPPHKKSHSLPRTPYLSTLTHLLSLYYVYTTISVLHVYHCTIVNNLSYVYIIIVPVIYYMYLFLYVCI